MIGFIAFLQAVFLTGGQTWPPQEPPVVVAPAVNGAARIRVDAADVTIGPVVIKDAYRAIETDAGVDTPRLHVRGLVATGLTRDGIRLRNAPSAVIEDFSLSHSEIPSEGEHLPEGIAITAGDDIVIRNGFVSGFKMKVRPGTYTNGDGIATEGKTTGEIRGVVSENNSDGGFDLKGTWRLDNLDANNNGRGFRIWGSATAGTLRANGWTSAAVWVGKGGRLVIDHLIATNSTTAPVIILGGQTVVEIKRCTFDRPKGPISKSEGSGNSLILGEGCT